MLRPRFQVSSAMSYAEQDQEDGDEEHRDHEPVAPERPEDDREREDRAELDGDVKKRRRES